MNFPFTKKSLTGEKHATSKKNAPSSKSSSALPATFALDIQGRSVLLRVRRHAKARRIILRIDPKNGAAVVTLPPRIALEKAVQMARQHVGWIAERLGRIGTAHIFTEGARVPVLGRDHVICRDRHGRGARIDDGLICVSGHREHTARRVRDALKSYARREIVRRVGEKVGQAGLKAGRIAIKDTRSRWGSCAQSGNLNFSWRLVMAPEYVLDYVIAHEVAHLRHPNHGPAFWRLVDTLCARVNDARSWLKVEGGTLHLYGQAP